MKRNCIIIPALEPDERLCEYIMEIRKSISGFIVVVDDGSGPEYRPLFDRIGSTEGCVVLRHDVNRGKGRALKTAFAYVKEHIPETRCLVCADCDGQHAPADVARILGEAEKEPGALHLGGRDFSGEEVPLRSRFGNRASSFLLWLVCGKWICDTQTGLRAFDESLLEDMISIPGERFEYEMQMLITCVRSRIPVRTHQIQTIYEGENEGSHFRPLQDSVRVMKALFAKTDRKRMKKRDLVFILTMIFSGIYLMWRVFFTIPWAAGTVQVCAGILLVLAELTTTLGMCELMVSKMKGRESAIALPDVPEELYPDVDVFIATHNEPADLLYKTINACTYLEYPDKDKVHVYVCDDGNREEIADLAAHLGVGYLGLADNQHAKSGNYNHALSQTRSPLVATFDSDMIPRRQFLIRTVPYFLDPELKMGLVQTPQSFYNQDLFQFNLFSEKDIPNEQDFFSREINVMRNSSNSAAYTGSNTVISRKALEEIGGFPYGTITEDFETSLRLQKAGYITYASEEVLAAGLSTTTVESMISQRVRWARGVIQSIRNTNAVFTSRLSLAARLSYLNAYLYWWSFLCRMIFILSPILFALFDFQLVECGFGELILFWLPSHLFYSMSVRYLSTNIRSLRWSQIIDTILAPYLILPVLLESVGISQKKFKVTDKKKQRERTTTWHYLIPHGILILLTTAAMLRYLHGKYGLALVYSSVILFWLGYNLMALVYAVFFMMGREAKRRYDRIGAEENVEFAYQGKRFEGRTQDVSEKGIAFVVKDAAPLQPGDDIDLIVFTEHYRAKLGVRIVYKGKTEDGTRFAASAEPVSEQDQRNWLQIIHDRVHSLPKEIDPWRTVYDDVVRNVRMRREGRKRRVLWKS